MNNTDFYDEKIIAFIMRGSSELVFVQRFIDIEILIESMLPQYKEILKIIYDYFLKYKMPPTQNMLIENYLVDIEHIQLISIIFDSEYEINDSEVGFVIDKIKTRYNLYLINKLDKKIKNLNTENLEFEEETEIIKDLNKSINRTISKIDRLRKNSVFSEGDFRKSTGERLNTYEYISQNQFDIDGIFTGYRDIDEYVYGLKKGELLTIVGGSSSGKSLLMLNIAANAWLGSNKDCYDFENIINDGKNIVYFSLEMSKKQLETRLDAYHADILHKNISRGRLDEVELAKFKKSLEFQKNYKYSFYIVDLPRGSTVRDIEARFDAISTEMNVDLVAVDYIGIMTSNEKNAQSDWLSVGAVASEIAEFARAKNVPVITAAQKKTRDKKNKNDDGNDIESVGRSKMIGDNSNVMFVIETRQDETLKEDFSLFITKNRDGSLGHVNLLKKFDRSRIDNMPLDWSSKISNSDT